MNQYQKLAESHTEKSIGTWEASYQLSKLNHFLCNTIEAIFYRKEHYPEDKEYIKMLEEQRVQIETAMEGPVWLRKARGEL